jgi:Asp-tRNA(Asn)/Glu-tRNA(Gln) amidotransferase A subunit family amidase
MSRNTLLSDRRGFLAFLSTFGVTSTLFPGVLWSMAQEEAKVTHEMIAHAASVAGIDIADEHREMMLEGLNNYRTAYEAIRKLNLANSVAPAILFDPVLPGMKFETLKRPLRMSRARVMAVPKNIEDVAFFTVRELAELIRTRKISSVALTEMYLARLKRYDPLLKFVITLTEDRALAQAKEADRDLARGKYRGPLHGLPWGAKDLLAVRGYRTTWGAAGFEEQRIEEDAEVVQRLDRAGAVLVAKLTLGALAQGDVWFGGMTRNPWKTDQGSSGSSAGSCSATSAGCVAFAMGSETLGSISSPSTRNGSTGLRPTFGRIPRTGAMALSWTMDKLGPICRAVEDCALVFDAIYGPDGKDRTVRDFAFNWDATLEPHTLRVGYLPKEFEREPNAEQLARETAEQKARREESKKFDRAALDVIQNKLGIKLIPLELPELPFQAMRPILVAEAAAAFDELTRSGRDKLLTAQARNDWPNTFRVARFIPAVEYINANRARTLGMEAMAKLFEKVDVIVTPTFSPQLLITNLTGHPAVILPHGFRESDGTPLSITFLGNLYGEARLMAVARAYQEATDFHRKHPDLEAALKKMQEAKPSP